MLNTEKARLESNEKKEQAKKAPFDIGMKLERPWKIPLKNEDVVKEICQVIISHNLNYIDANEVLHQADRALQQKVYTEVIT
jgi:hypothetical protein